MKLRASFLLLLPALTVGCPWLFGNDPPPAPPPPTPIPHPGTSTTRDPGPPPPPPSTILPPFCSEAEHQLRTSPYPPHPRNRMARVSRDMACSRHAGILCAASAANNPITKPPTSCIDVEVSQGDPLTALGGQGQHPLLCVECPQGLLPTLGQALCSSADVADGTNQRMVFNLSGDSAEQMERDYAAAMKAKARSDASDGGEKNPDLWAQPLAEIVRTLAPQLGYCEPHPFGLAADDHGWRYDAPNHRQDLRSQLTYAGDGVPGGAAAAVVLAAGMSAGGGGTGFNVWGTAFYDAPRKDQLNIDSLAVTILHEMRHMATQNLGHGDAAANEVVQNAEHWLNELEDYTRMFEHPWLIGLAPKVVQRMREEFGYGRNVEYGCFANVWGDGGPTTFPGYPSDSEAAVIGAAGPLALGGIAGFGGQLPVMGAGERPVWPYIREKSNWDSTGWTPSQCDSLHIQHKPDGSLPVLADPADRCAVAQWARKNDWMASMMIRSVAPAAEHQPWNTLAHYVLVLPFRVRPYAPCAPATE